MKFIWKHHYSYGTNLNFILLFIIYRRQKLYSECMRHSNKFKGNIHSNSYNTNMFTEYCESVHWCDLQVGIMHVL